MADIDYREATGFDEPQAGADMVTPLVNWAGALISIGLIAGLGIWGYKLTIRDVSGIPVVRALEGPARVQPEDPGGRLAVNQGLAVNRVQAEGQAEPAAERLILAPEPIAVIEGDAPAALPDEAREAATPAPEAGRETAPDSGRLAAAQPAPQPESVEELAEQIALNVSRESVLPASAGPAAPASPRVEVIPASVPGVAVSLRPSPRPAEEIVEARLAAARSVTDAPTATDEIAPASIPEGTRLVQLGAFDTAEDARRVWDMLIRDFGDYFTGKSRVVQEAESGGRIFYRLRAMGFADLGDARRFCSVLLAEDAACIPVVAR